MPGKGEDETNHVVTDDEDEEEEKIEVSSNIVKSDILF